MGIFDAIFSYISFGFHLGIHIVFEMKKKRAAKKIKNCRALLCERKFRPQHTFFVRKEGENSIKKFFFQEMFRNEWREQCNLSTHTHITANS